MIYVAGEQFDPTALLRSLSGIERGILESMAESSEAFRFGSEGELNFTLTLRAQTANAARDLNKSGLEFAVFRDSRCNTMYWERKDNGGFLLREGVSPATAIRDIFINGRKYATECATAMVIVNYGALLRVYGDALFNRTFPRIYLMNWSGLDPLLKDIGIPHKTETLIVGDRGYFNNPDYDPEDAEWRGENVIVLPNGLYYGHGMGILPAERIIAELNKHRKPNATRTAYQTDTAARPNYAALYARYAASAPVAFAPPLVWQPFPPSRRGRAHM